MSQPSPTGSSYFKAYLKCPKYFDYKYNKLITGKGEKLALVIGTAFHDGLQVYYTSKKRKLDPMEGFEKCVLAGMKIIEESKLADKSKWIQYITRLFTDYDQRWINEDKDWEVVGTEFPSVVMINGVLYTGRMDLVIKQISTGLYFVVDHKTTSSDLASYFREFSEDLQGTGYTYIGDNVSNVPIAGIIINAVWKHKDKKESFTFDRNIYLKTSRDYAEFEETISSIELRILEDRGSNKWMKNRTSCWDYHVECEYRKLCNYGESEDILHAFYERGEPDVR